LGGLFLVLTAAIGDAAPVLGPIRVVLGIAYVLYVPGFCMVAAVFPDTGDLDPFEKLGLRIGLSVAIVPLLALLLSQLPWGIQPWPIVVSELGFTLLLIGISLWRRSLTSKELRHARTNKTQRFRPWWNELQPDERRHLIAIVGVLVVALAAVGWVLLIPSPDSFTTEFYVLGPNGLAEGYPRVAAPNADLTATLGIANLEHDEHTYQVETWVTDSRNASRRILVARSATLTLPPGLTKQWSTAWRMPWAGDDQVIDFLLFVDGKAQAYRELSLRVDVTPPTPVTLR
jgi:uncharacterized membrane protein